MADELIALPTKKLRGEHGGEEFFVTYQGDGQWKWEVTKKVTMSGRAGTREAAGQAALSWIKATSRGS